MNNDLNIKVSDYTAHLSPGKFEGEQPATQYFHEQMLAGDGEILIPIAVQDGPDDFTCEDSPCGTIFHINADESEAFNLPIGHWFLLFEDNQGFAYGRVYETREAAESAFSKE